MDTTLYPMKFLPLYKNKVWGGNKIKTLGFDYAPLPNCGELWALSGVEGNESVIANGFLQENTINEAIEIYMGELVGEKNFDHFGTELPILIKIIDANDKLSIQVHPDDQLARQRGMENGKTEMWYILEAEPGAEIVDGFEQALTPKEYQQKLAAGQVEELLHIERPEAGDMFFIPAGRVHALGKGLLLAEVQQTSDCTYRIYDYNRPDSDGRLRELHTAEALAAIDFAPTRDGKSHYAYRENCTTRLAECPYFTTNLIPLTKPMRKDFSSLDSFVVYLCVDGVAAVKTLDTILPIHTGECVLVPAVADRVELFCEGSAKLLEIYADPKQWTDDSRSHLHDMDWTARYIGNNNPEDYLDSLSIEDLEDIADTYEEEGEDCGCHHEGHDCNCHHHHDEEDCGCGHHHHEGDCGCHHEEHNCGCHHHEQ